jgi:hypothetical protein
MSSVDAMEADQAAISESCPASSDFRELSLGQRRATTFRREVPVSDNRRCRLAVQRANKLLDRRHWRYDVQQRRRAFAVRRGLLPDVDSLT